MENLKFYDATKRYLPLYAKSESSLPASAFSDHNKVSGRNYHRTPGFGDSRGKGTRLGKRKTFSHLPDELLHRISTEKSKAGHLQGIFPHYKAKNRKYLYEDLWKPKDCQFPIDVGTQFDSTFKGRLIQFHGKRSEVFYHIVDLDTHEYHKVLFHDYLNSVLQSSFFRFTILGLVLTSAVLIGLTTVPEFESYNTYFRAIDQIILSVFIFEISVKWMYDFRLFWKVYWNIADFLIVAIIAISAVLPLGGSGRAFVIIRVVRAFRTLKSLSSFTSLTIVIQTVDKSGADVLSILVVLMIFMLVLSIMGVILYDIKEVSDGTAAFHSALNAWYTLFVCVTEDGWVADYKEFKKLPNHKVILTIFLILGVVVGSWILANLIIAVIVANLEVSVKELKEELMLSDDPLNTKEGFIISQVGIIPTYELFAQNTLSMMIQRPMKIPSLRYISLRRIHAYLSIIVAMEQNLLEAEIIHLDLERIMAVILSIILQIDLYSADMLQREKQEGNELLEDMQRLEEENYQAVGTFERMHKHAEMQKLKKNIVKTSL